MKKNYVLFFVESVCTDMNIILSNVLKTKLQKPDYEGQKPEDAIKDFLDRIK